MTVQISKPALNLREELASLRNQGGLPKEDKLYVDTLENGDFSAGTVGWTEYNYLASVSASNGELTVTATGTGNGSYAYQRISTKVGKTYRVTATVVTTGQAYVRANLNTIHPWNFDGAMSFSGTANVTKSFTFVASQDHIFLGLGTNNSTVGNSATYSSITMQEIGENLVTNGTFDYDSGWSLGTNASISGGTLSYSGGSGNVNSYQNIGLEANKTYHITATVSGYVQGHLSFRAGNNTTDTPDITANGTYDFVFTVPSNGNNNFMIDASDTFVGSIDNIIVTEGSHPVIQSIPYGYDVKDVYIDGELAREGEAYDYEVQTDGINQWLKPTVEPTATTETVVIGVRK
jgi:hypothetical protein